MKTANIPCGLCLALLVVLAGSCQQRQTDKPADQAKEGPAQQSADTPPKNVASGEQAQAFEGKPPPESAEMPGPDGPFVEPTLLERPRELHHVVAGKVADLESAHKLIARLGKVKAVPVGYPSVDQAGGGGGWLVLAGKFARGAFARSLADVLRSKGFDRTMVVVKPYRHDRLRPSVNLAQGVKAGRVFSGVAGMEVPILTAPAKDAPGAAMVKDGALVRVVAQQDDSEGAWFRIQAGDKQGFLPASRLLVDYNVFPAPCGTRAVLGVPLGSPEGESKWDYWLVGRGFDKRDLLRPAAERMPHAFSPDGDTLAYVTQDPVLKLSFKGKHSELSLGPGTSPSWSPKGSHLYFRRPARAGARDEVMVAATEDWAVRTVLDFHGKPTYPRALSVIPPAVDMHEEGRKLFTMFYRLVDKDGGMAIHRWKILFTPEGKIVSKKGEQITE